jgi:hypothetical protein
MPKRSAKTQTDFKHTWYLREWMAQSVPPKKQADLQKELGWSKAKAHDVWHGQQYTQAIIDEVAPWLNVKPFELLLSPAAAMAIRGYRESAAQLASSAELPGSGESAPRSRTGTAG